MSSSYIRRMAVLSAKIFGNIPRPVSERSAKVIQMYKQKPMGQDRLNYYPPLDKFNVLLQKLRHLGIYHDEYLDFKEEMKARRIARGKIPPKKGEGKRSKKK
ncbi:small ribosomal subunit protein mS33-like [Rhopilema esculentum]|uniref:small ribosomal subunit protein mS33-like n=1 Tax=Rhopilema esculentum TaxID=499914 RepID=UPI0031CDE58E